MSKKGEKMDLNELNEWVETEAGKQWLEGMKQPLLNNRDELLAALHESNAKVSELGQRSGQAEAALEKERAVLSNHLIDKELARILETKHVMKPAIPGVIAELRQSYGLTVKNIDDVHRMAIGKIKTGDVEKELALDEIVDAWSTTKAAKEVTLQTNTGGGAMGSGRYGAVSRPREQLGKMTSQQLGRMSDADFTTLRAQALNGIGAE
jgi:hypothetical protein